MKQALSGAATGSAISYGLFGDPWFALLAFTLAVSALAFIFVEEVYEQD